MKFIEYLNLIKEKYKITNKELLTELNAEKLKITTSNLSHKLNGDRSISKDEFDIMLKTIRPSSDEEKNIRKLFNIYQFGEKKYEEVIFIKEYIKRFGNKETIFFKKSNINLDEISVIDNEKLLLDVLFDVFSNAWKKDTIKVFCQPQYKKLIDALNYLQETSPSKIEHIICLNNDYKADSNTYNIRCLMSIDNLAFSNINYKIRYFYDKINDFGNDFSVFPYFVVAGDSLILISADFRSGYLSKDPALIFKMTVEFNRMYSRATDLFQYLNNDLEYLSACVEMEQVANKTYYTLQNHYCLISGVTEEILRSCGKFEVPYAETVLQIQCSRYKKENVKGYQLYSDDDFTHFLETGIYEDLPPAICNPIAKNMRNEMIRMAKSNKAYSQLKLDEKFLEIPQKLLISCSDNGTAIISYQKENNMPRLLLKERTLYKSIKTFFEYALKYEINNE